MNSAKIGNDIAVMTAHVMAVVRNKLPSPEYADRQIADSVQDRAQKVVAFRGRLEFHRA